ncbi:chromosome segregation ATPase [Agrobacterium vitis]|nr:chromosome segregation ATPase [Agrobacterium vitis]MBE1440382.1 chromosome segregation ATPase [Agrobacterium vitis]
MTDLVSVTLTGPAKIDGRRKPAGTTIEVSTTLALQLAASRVINPELARSLSDAVNATPLESDFQAAVDAAVAGRLEKANAKAMLDAAAVTSLEAARDALKAKVTEANVLLTEAREEAAAWKRLSDEATGNLTSTEKALQTARDQIAELERQLSEQAKPEQAEPEATEQAKPAKTAKATATK